MKTLYVLLHLFTCLAFADAPPVSVKGQNGSRLLPKWNLQLPNSSATNLGGIDALLETGNQNVLANPGFEGSPFGTGWTCANFTCAAQTTYFSDGKQGGTVANANTVNVVTDQSVTPSYPTTNRTWQAGMWINTNAQGFQVCSLVGGVEQACVDAPSNSLTNLVQPPMFVTTSATTVGVRLKSINTNAKQVFYDGGFVVPGVVGSSSPDTIWTDAGANTVGATTAAGTKGTVSQDHFYWRRVGTNMEVRVEYAQTAAGTAGTGDYLWTIPAATGCSITGMTFNNLGSALGLSGQNILGTYQASAPGTDATVGGFVSAYSANQVRFYGAPVSTYANAAYNGQNGFNFANSSLRIAAQYSVPCLGWTPQTAIQTQNSNYGMIAYAPTYTGLGSPTLNEAFQKRNGEFLVLDFKVTFGTTTATGATISLPGTLAVAGTDRMPSTRKVGSCALTSAGGATAVGDSVIVTATASGTTLGFGFRDSTNGALVTRAGTALGAAGDTMSCQAWVPITGWSENQNAPQLIGSVTSPAAASTIIVSGTVQGSSTTPTILSGGAGVSTLTRNATGDVTVNFTAATYTTLYGCTCTHSNSNVDGHLADICAISTQSNTAVRFVIYNPASSAAFDDNFGFICHGAK